MAVRSPLRIAYAFRLALIGLAAQAACGGKGTPVVPLDRESLLDPDACQSCHPTAYREWSGSMHAYAADDPVFLAMNARAQRETGGAVGKACVTCHAPLAVRDGLNLDTLPKKMKGVTCYFCHAVESVTDTHNNPLKLAEDDSLFGPFSDPVASTPHKGIYSRLLDSATVESASMCGACHDIQNLQGAHVERTFEEWGKTRFSQPPNGLTCASSGCHMKATTGPASTISTNKTRTLHAHAFPAVDLAVTDFPEKDTQRAQAQALLADLIQPTLCYNTLTQKMDLTLENVTAGHSFPSGATPDRRAWIELTAYSGDTVTYSTGGAAAMPLENSADPDLWLMRDCLFDGAGTELKMFWQATTAQGNAVPGSVIQDFNNPKTFNQSHPKWSFPQGAGLPGMPDRVNLKIHLQAIGDDVLKDLVDTGYLDASIPPLIARYELGGASSFDWTPATSSPKNDPDTRAALLCIVKPIAFRTNTWPADSNAHCKLKPPDPSP